MELPLLLPPKLKKRKGLDKPVLPLSLLLEFVGDVAVADAVVEDDWPFVVAAVEEDCDGNGKNRKNISDELFV